MAARRLLLSTLCLFFFTNTGCSQKLVWSEIISDIRNKHPEVTQVSVDSLASWLDDESAQQPMIFDVREHNEYEVSHLAGAVQLNPDTNDFARLDQVAKDTPIVVYCSVGYRSSSMADRLQAAGFTNVSNLEGSIFTWVNAGYPVVQGDKPASSVHPFNKVWGMLLKKEYRY